MSKCFLQGYGACRGKASREHFISETVLRQLSLGKTVTIGGLPWQPSSTLQDIGIGALQAKILCEGHNNRLSVLDSIAGALLRTLDVIDKDPDSIAALVQFRGPIVERWFLKVICGLVAGQGTSDRPVPDEWKRLLTGDAWPTGWGLYCFNPGGSQILSKDVHIETRVDPKTEQILATQFFYGGVCFFLLLGKPDVQGAFGVHRPRGLIFEQPRGERRIEFLWPVPTDDAVIYTRVDTTSNVPSYQWDWKR